jgi:polar amino acid transport system permease protein
MALRSHAATLIVSFTAGLAVASFAGFREFLPAWLDGVLMALSWNGASRGLPGGRGRA